MAWELQVPTFVASVEQVAVVKLTEISAGSPMITVTVDTTSAIVSLEDLRKAVSAARKFGTT